MITAQERFKSRSQQEDFEEAPSESFADIMVLNRRRRPQLHDDDGKDRFIELAQAALEEATLEDERKGVIYEVVEALIAKTGAPLVAEVISEQLRSQEVIERLAESHEEEEEQRRLRSKQNVFAPTLLKEPPDAVLQPADEDDRRLMISEYIWRLFRILILASLVGLVYHFMCAYHQNLF
ncbi:hypothetical protein BJV82DRAFT_612949 [Fennellomyces sp. T-0311]|nr:hypothetical protein BJV82DRAFT_612949 [Fennellomyces sp. T-0311]